MTKTYRLTYESAEVMHALFDKTSATQGFRISSRVLREYVEYFGPKTEQLDLLAQDGKVVLTSFTEKIQDGKGMLSLHLRHIEADFDFLHQKCSSNHSKQPFQFIPKTSRTSTCKKDCIL